MDMFFLKLFFSGDSKFGHLPIGTIHKIASKKWMKAEELNPLPSNKLQLVNVVYIMSAFLSKNL